MPERWKASSALSESWMEDFVIENELKVGQVLFFALSADSLFIVRGVAPSSTEDMVGPDGV